MTIKPTRINYAENKTNITEWNFGTEFMLSVCDRLKKCPLGDLESLLNKLASDIRDEAVKIAQSAIELAIDDNDKFVALCDRDADDNTDPTRIRFVFPTGSNSIDGPMFEFSLHDLISNELMYHGEIDKSKLSSELHKLADMAISGGHYYKHLKRGTTYIEVGRGELQRAYAQPLVEGDKIVCYRSMEDGRLCFREATEFDDGRFVKIDQL